MPLAVLRKLSQDPAPSTVANKSETYSTFCPVKNRKTTLIHAFSSLMLKLVLSSSYGCSGKTTTGSYRQLQNNAQ